MKVINTIDLNSLRNMELRNLRNRHNKETLGVYFYADYEVAGDCLVKTLNVVKEEPARLHHKAKINSRQELGMYIEFIKSCEDAHLGIAYLEHSCTLDEAIRLNVNEVGKVYSNEKEAHEEYCLLLKDTGQIDTLVNLACKIYCIRTEYGHEYSTYDFGSAFVAIDRNA